MCSTGWPPPGKERHGGQAPFAPASAVNEIGWNGHDRTVVNIEYRGDFMIALQGVIHGKDHRNWSGGGGGWRGRAAGRGGCASGGRAACLAGAARRGPGREPGEVGDQEELACWPTIWSGSWRRNGTTGNCGSFTRNYRRRTWRLSDSLRGACLRDCGNRSAAGPRTLRNWTSTLNGRAKQRKVRRREVQE